MLDPQDSGLVSQEKGVPPGAQSNPEGTPNIRAELPYNGTVRLVGHRVNEDQDGTLHVGIQIMCEGRTFDGTASGPAALPDRLRVPALATLRALDDCLQIFYHGDSNPALVLDDVVEVSVGDFPVAVVMVTASEKAKSTPVVAACPLIGMSDLAIIVATLQATVRIVSHWLAWGDRNPPPAEQMRPQ